VYWCWVLTSFYAARDLGVVIVIVYLSRAVLLGCVQRDKAELDWHAARERVLNFWRTDHCASVKWVQWRSQSTFSSVQFSSVQCLKRLCTLRELNKLNCENLGYQQTTYEKQFNAAFRFCASWIQTTLKTYKFPLSETAAEYILTSSSGELSKNCVYWLIISGIVRLSPPFALKAEEWDKVRNW